MRCFKVLSHEWRVRHAKRARCEVIALEEVREVRQMDDLRGAQTGQALRETDWCLAHPGVKESTRREGLQELHGHPQPPRGMHNVQPVQVLLEPVVEEVVNLTKPRERRLVLWGEGRVDVDNDVPKEGVGGVPLHDSSTRYMKCPRQVKSRRMREVGRRPGQGSIGMRKTGIIVNYPARTNASSVRKICISTRSRSTACGGRCPAHRRKTGRPQASAPAR